jgi:hypothetical protein
MRKLANSLNRHVFVASPAFFGNQQAHQCLLVDMEVAGLWLRGDTVSGRLREIIDLPPPDNMPVDVFLPFDQIVCVFDPTQFAFAVRGPVMPAAPEKTGGPAEPHAPEPGAARSRRHGERSKHKAPKHTR